MKPPAKVSSSGTPNRPHRKRGKRRPQHRHQPRSWPNQRRPRNS